MIKYNNINDINLNVINLYIQSYLIREVEFVKFYLDKRLQEK